MTIADDLRALLGAARRVIGLRVIFRDQSGRSGLDGEWLFHEGPACRRAKGPPDGPAVCWAFCAGTVLRELAATCQARIHTCPFGYTEIAVPVHSRERFLGVVFAGPCWLGEGPAPTDVAPVPDRAWLEDRLLLLRGLAQQIAAVLDEAPVVESDRQARIVAFIEANLAGDLQLSDLAAALDLSPSRSGHLVKELFGLTFPALVRRTRMQAAARHLAAGGLGVAEVAAKVGCHDAAWFARQFRLVHGMTPSAWRAQTQSA